MDIDDTQPFVTCFVQTPFPLDFVCARRMPWRYSRPRRFAPHW